MKPSVWTSGASEAESISTPAVINIAGRQFKKSARTPRNCSLYRLVAIRTIFTSSVHTVSVAVSRQRRHIRKPRLEDPGFCIPTGFRFKSS
jgi:hypothetical protein